MTQVNVASRKWRDAQGRERRFHYGLLIREVAAEPFFCEDYGVRVCADREFVPSQPVRVQPSVQADV